VSQPIEVLIVVSDLHCGSVFALCPPVVSREEGGDYLHNPVQRFIWECWQDFCNVWVPSVVNGRPFAVVVNGDAVEGSHHGGHQIISQVESLHAEVAKACLLMLTEGAAGQAERVFVVRGTETHVKQTSESSLGFALGAEQDPDTRQFASHHWLLDIHGCPCSFQHHISTSTRISLYGTGLSVHMAEEQLQAARFGQVVPRVIGRAHRHTFGKYDDAEGLIFTTPSWQGLTNHGRKVVPGAVPRFGGLALDWGNRPPGSLPSLLSRIYQPARREAVKL
jgi:hypothetical protein